MADLPQPKVVPEATPEQVAAARAAAPATAEDAIEATRKEYGIWVAATEIRLGYALIHNPGDPVPVSNVEHYGWAAEGRVVKVGTKAHKELRARLGLPPLED